MKQPGNTVDQLLAFRFAVEIDGIHQAVFNECSGLGVQTEVFEYKEGGLNGYSLKFPGHTSYSNITLKWGIADTTDLWDWYNRLLNDPRQWKERKDVSVIHYDSEGKQIRRWNLASAFPVKWSGPSFNATSSVVSIESLELAFNDFTAVAG